MESKLLSLGANSYGQLGTGHKEDAIVPVETLPLLVDGSAVQVQGLQAMTGGGGHSVMLTRDGKLFVCGWNKEGQLGLPFCDSVPVLRPLDVGMGTRIIEVSCGWNHTLALSEAGSVLAWGSNAFGQLGVSRPDLKRTCEPLELDRDAFGSGGEDTRVTSIVAGLRHSLAVTDKGSVCSWGSGKRGQLGYHCKAVSGCGKRGIQPLPKQVPLVRGVKVHEGVAAGAYHSMAVTESGSVLVWGWNQHSQCGTGTPLDPPHAQQPPHAQHANVSGVHQMEGLPPSISEVHCGWSHSVAISSCRRVFVWGRGDYGQLGTTPNNDSNKAHRTDTALQPLIGSVHVAAPEPSPTASEGSEAADDTDTDTGGVGGVAGAGVWCLRVPTEISSLAGVKQFACGSEHNIAINALDQVVTFGWNEHGVCGNGTQDNVLVPRHLDLTQCCLLHGSTGWQGEMVGTGAGHSFVLTYVKKE